jgi:hypothetical protein
MSNRACFVSDSKRYVVRSYLLDQNIDSTYEDTPLRSVDWP